MTANTLLEYRNIYCVGRNYRLHAAELGNAVPDSPMIFSKPSHAAIALNNEAIELPGGVGSVHYEAELVFRAGRSYEPGIAMEDLYTHFTVGLDLTLREVQDVLKAKGYPWLAAKGFIGSAPLGEWISFESEELLNQGEFRLLLNGDAVQIGRTADMIFSLRTLTDHVGKQFGIGQGDLLFTGTPAGVGELHKGDKAEVYWNQQSLGAGIFELHD